MVLWKGLKPTKLSEEQVVSILMEIFRREDEPSKHEGYESRRYGRIMDELIKSPFAKKFALYNSTRVVSAILREKYVPTSINSRQMEIKTRLSGISQASPELANLLEKEIADMVLLDPKSALKITSTLRRLQSQLMHKTDRNTAEEILTYGFEIVRKRIRVSTEAAYNLSNDMIAELRLMSSPGNNRLTANQIRDRLEYLDRKDNF